MIEEDCVETFDIEDEGVMKEETVERAANVKHNSVVYIKVGQYELEDEIPVEVTSMSGEVREEIQTVSKMVDEDQQGKALSVQG